MIGSIWWNLCGMFCDKFLAHPTLSRQFFRIIISSGTVTSSDSYHQSANSVLLLSILHRRKIQSISQNFTLILIILSRMKFYRRANHTSWSLLLEGPILDRMVYCLELVNLARTMNNCIWVWRQSSDIIYLLYTKSTIRGCQNRDTTLSHIFLIILIVRSKIYG
jgi:hypothetical protein